MDVDDATRRGLICTCNVCDSNKFGRTVTEEYERI